MNYFDLAYLFIQCVTIAVCFAIVGGTVMYITKKVNQ